MIAVLFFHIASLLLTSLMLSMLDIPISAVYFLFAHHWPLTPDPWPLVLQPPDPQELEQGKNMRVALFLIIAIVTSSISLGIAFGIRRKIDQVAGPIEEEDD